MSDDLSGFEVFIPERKRRTYTEPIVTLGRAQQFTVSIAAHEAMGCPDAVVLLYDRARDRIAFRPVAFDTAHAYRVGKSGGSQSRIVTGRTFCAHFGIRTPERQQFTLVGSENNLFVLVPAPPAA